ncbi:alpha-galactosidase [Subtercola sp. RTI3]|uniref:alpha-galactosidase n=1 Tax=Subtercola sp. RTI3 TaxID=3048639 RepID=UPI002B22A659|nr:alpha-galactosidase [Subtercola sp. RTI3]MEA9984115.1 alpha-galactosidase [Subtercola sp. RTI3]
MPDVRIETGNDRLEIVLVHSGDTPLRIARWGLRGATADVAGGQPLVEILTVDAGHVPSTPRLVGTAVGSRLRYVGHSVSERPGWSILSVELAEQRAAVGWTGDGDPLEAGLSVVASIEVPLHAAAARVVVTVTNGGGQARVLRSVTSLALRVGLGTDLATAPRDLDFSWAKSDWIGESRWQTESLEQAGLVELELASHENSDARGCLSFASSGSWSSGQVVPTGALASRNRTNVDGAGAGVGAGALDAAGGGALAWQIEHNGGWRYELGENHEGSYLALSGPTDDDHQWLAVLEPGDSFTTVPVTLAAGTDLESAFAALTDYRRAARRGHPDARALPVVFNDYMNTLMGDPTTARLLPLIDAAAEAGAEVFCIDAGWYDDSGDWWYSVGEWKPSTVRFPRGLAEVVEHIRSKDMVPGIWLEPEVVGVHSAALAGLPEEAFFSRHGQRVVEHGRYHLDFRHPAAIAHVDEVVDRLVAEFGIGYFKLDYNINPGAGTDLSASSAGEGLLQHNRAHLAWLDAVLDRHPALTIENCASGAMRMDFAMLSRLQLQSTSDQQHPHAYPPIAAAAPLSMLPEQAANWAYPQPAMSDEEIAFTLCTGILGRFYLSGHLDTMSIPQQTLVAEAVAAHKRVRHEIAVSHATWPLGLEQWDSPWVAFALGDTDSRLLTVWKRLGADARIEIPLPAFAGGPLVVSTVFPRRLQPWEHEWNAHTGILTLFADVEGVSARTLRVSREPRTENVVVDLASDTGEVHGGATGMLYGLADVGVPSAALIAGVRPRTMAQKAPGGKQHPNGDAVALADGFFAAGGREMVVYMQDAFEQWPYEDLGLEHFREVVRAQVRIVAARPDSDRFVWVPFNEGDWIWYTDWQGGAREAFLAAWQVIVHEIRALDAHARIAGPNESHYFPERVRDFFEFCVANDVLPDVMSWHELQPSSLEVYRPHYEHYRALERELGFGPLPINIDEYGNRRDMSVPGQLIQWIDLFESTKVDADLAYWSMAGNLDDHAVGTNQANSGWWLLRWYAQLAGHTLRVEVPQPAVRDSLRALAALDTGVGAGAGAGVSAGVVTVLLGGTDCDIAVTLTGFAAAGLPATVRLRVERLGWSGYQGDSLGGDLIVESIEDVSDDRLRVVIPNTDSLAAYRVRVLAQRDTVSGRGVGDADSPHADSSPADSVDVDSTGAELVDCVVSRHGDDPQGYTGWGRAGISSMPAATSSARFTIDVAAAGDHELALFYGTDSIAAQLALSIDDAESLLIQLPATLSRTYTARVDHRVTLSRGSHTVTLSTALAGVHLEASDVSLDRIRLTAVTAKRFIDVLDATTPDPAAGAGIGVGVGNDVDAALLFFVAVAARGRYRLTAAVDAVFEIEGRPAGGRDVFLPLGVSRVTVRHPAGPATVLGLTITPVPDAQTITLAAPSFEPLSSPGGTVQVDVPAGLEGEYCLTIVFSNADKSTGHLYNADVINRSLDIGLDDEPPVRVWFGHTYDWENRAELTVPIRLSAGQGILKLGALDGPGPTVYSLHLDRLASTGARR